MTKQDEIELLAAITADVPRATYLRDTLAELAPVFETAIRSDLSASMIVSHWSSLQTGKQQLADETSDLRTRLDDLKAEVKAQENALFRVNRAVAAAKKEAGDLATILRQAS